MQRFVSSGALNTGMTTSTDKAAGLFINCRQKIP
jgi:hypothetical protein